MKHGSLFSGIGGFDLAAEWMGWENVFHCEWNEFGQKVLKYYWPKAISYEDITKSDFTIHRGNIDILTGGFPCQPYSSAGKRLGKEDERHLWPQMLRAIREIKPRWVVGENVYGLVNWSGGLVFHEVQADLEAEGYEVQPYLLPAVSVNAPHRRDRIWFVAHANTNGFSEQRRYECSCQNDERGIAQSQWSADSENFDNGYTSEYVNGKPNFSGRIGSERYSEKGEPSDPRGIRWMDKKCDKCQGIVKVYRDTTNQSRTLVQERQSGVQLPINSRMGDNQTTIESDRRDEQENDNNNIKTMDWDATEPMQIRLQQCEDGREMGGGQSEVCGAGRESANAIETNGEIQNVAYTSSRGMEGYGGSSKDKQLQTTEFEQNNSEKFRRMDWGIFPTQSPVCNGNDGISNRLDSITFPKWRNESIKAGGNAIVPQVVYQIFKSIEQYERPNSRNDY